MRYVLVVAAFVAWAVIAGVLGLLPQWSGIPLCIVLLFVMATDPHHPFNQ